MIWWQERPSACGPYRSTQFWAHCKDTVPKIRNKHSQKIAATVPISTFMCLWAIYIFPRSVCLFCCRKICGQILRMNKSLTETWMWKLGLRGRSVPRKGIHKWDFRCRALWTMIFVYWQHFSFNIIYFLYTCRGIAILPKIWQNRKCEKLYGNWFPEDTYIQRVA